jgi:hypothetical protein
MEVVNEVNPTSPERIQEMLRKGPEGPIYMVNLLKFKQEAEYEDGRDTNLSGYEAYQIYAKAVSKLLPEFGGEFFFAGDVTFLLLGQVEELWDEVAIAVHRTAGLAGQLNIETVAQPRAAG